MTISDKEQELIRQEEDLLAEIRTHLASQLEETSKRLQINSNLARDLTQQLVASTRDEDKAMLASDEAVAHKLSSKSFDGIETIRKQINEPYFARIELEEDLENGKTKKIEYKLGKRSNPDCRIIDWRKAPIAKLYYEYEEGDLYSEEILQKERCGEVKLKNSYEIRKGILKTINSTLGNFIKNNGSWQKKDTRTISRKSYSFLPDILALITPEQFSSITKDSDTPVLIQGVAGSGKTAVAVHRLSWLLHSENSDLNDSDIKIILKSPLLKTYIVNTLKEIEHESVKTFTIKDYAKDLVKTISPNLLHLNQLNSPRDATPSTAKRVIYSQAFTEYILKVSKQNPISRLSDAFSLIESALKSPERIIELDKTRLLSKDNLKITLDRFYEHKEENCFDTEFWITALLIYQAAKPREFISYTKHFIIDEIQDFSLTELILVFGCLEKKHQVTLVGDINQSIDFDVTFPGWKFILNALDIHNESELIKLNVSHRSTLPIIKFAENFTQNKEVSKGREGRVPIWFKCSNESDAILATIRWLSLGQEKYPNAATAIICKTPEQAKQLYSFLEPTFKSAVQLADSSFTFSAGIVVTDIKNVKGLEFYNVLMWDVSARNYPQNSLSRNLLYVSATRAEENLCLISFGRPSVFLESTPRNLVRAHVFQSKEAEE